MLRNRRRALLVSVVVIIVVVGTFVGIRLTTPSVPPLTPAQRAAIAAQEAARRLLATETKVASIAKRSVAVVLPKRPGQPAPATPATLYRVPLRPHLVVSFVPYYTLSFVDADDLTASSVVVYSSLCVGTKGTISTTGLDCSNGWNDLQSSGFTSLATEAHADGDRVLLSVSNFDDTSIGQLLAHPIDSATRLAGAVVPILTSDDLDGVNLDIEGSSSSNAGRYVTFVRAFAAAFRAADPTGELMLDSYAASASSTPSFFDVKALAPLVDQIFIEAYQMDNPAQSSANSPLVSPTLGYSVAQSLVQYEKEAPASKLVLGLPFYGLDFTTKGTKPGSPAKTAAPAAYWYSDIVAAGHSPLWDPTSETPYSLFRKDGSWHQLWYDDPVSLALKVAVAAELHTAGVGVWAIGMDGGSSALLAALTGGSDPVKLAISR